MMSQKRRLQINSSFQIIMLRLVVLWVLRFSAHIWSRFGHPWNVLLNYCSGDLIGPLNFFDLVKKAVCIPCPINNNFELEASYLQ